MTNFRRALLALITFITGVGLSLGVGAGIASAHHASITGVPTCVDLKTNTYGVTWTLDPTEDRFQYSVDQAGWSPAGSNTWTNHLLTAGFPYPNSTWTKSDYPSNANATVTAGINWRDFGHTNPDYQADATGNVTKPTNTCPLTSVTPAVTYTPPTCFAAGTVVATPGTGFTWSNNGLDPVTFTATALPGYSLTQSVFGPYAIASIISTDACKPSYDPSVTVVETVCTEGATQVTITTTTTTYHAEFINGVWVKVADEPTVVVTFRPLLEGEIVTCVPTHEPKVVTVDDGVPACGDTSVNTITTTTTYTYTYVDGVWVETATDVVTHGSRAVVTEPCPTTPTTQPPVTTQPLVPTTPLPVTGRGTDGLTIGAILFGAGTLALAATRRRKVSNA